MTLCLPLVVGSPRRDHAVRKLHHVNCAHAVVADWLLDTLPCKAPP
jgi:hypothetical protein